MANDIDTQLRDLKFEQRLEQIALLSRHDKSAGRSQLATAMIRELAMHRLFDRFTKPQQQKLLDVLQPMATAADVVIPPAFGQGAVSQLRFSYE